MLEPLREFKNGFEYNGVTYHSGDLVLAEGEIGNIEQVDDINGRCLLGCSMPMSAVNVREDFSDVTISAGLECTIVGMRKANKEEQAAFERFSHYLYRVEREASIRRERLYSGC